MSIPLTPSPPLQMARLEEPETIGDVIRNLDQIIDWSIKAESHIGFPAVGEPGDAASTLHQPAHWMQAGVGMQRRTSELEDGPA